MLSRSLLFVPAHKEKMLLKINQLQADIVLLDLEDAVAMEDKQASRDLIETYIYQFEKSIFIRINSMETDEFSRDIDLINKISEADALQGIMLPKSSSKNDILKLESQLKNKLLIIPLIESARGLHHMDEIITASDCVYKVAFGGEDFTNDIRAQATVGGTELLYARSKIVVSSRAHNIGQPIDTVYTDFQNADGFKENCSFVKSIGFGGKLLIHPNQIDAANTTFAPSAEEIERAREIVSHSKVNQGAFSLHGKMIDKPIIEKAQKTINDYTLIQSK